MCTITVLIAVTKPRNHRTVQIESAACVRTWCAANGNRTANRGVRHRFGTSIATRV